MSPSSAVKRDGALNVKRRGWGPPYGFSGPLEPRKRVQRAPIPFTFEYFQISNRPLDKIEMKIERE
jgi:hypothetical protein